MSELIELTNKELIELEHLLTRRIESEQYQRALVFTRLFKMPEKSKKGR